MEHQFYIDRLSAYFDNELKNEELVIVKEHVMGCSECQKKLQELEKLENLIIEKSDLSESDYWEQSAQKIESALSSQTEAAIITVGKSSKSSLWWKLTGVAASLVLVALFAFEQKDNSDEILRQEAPKTGIKHVIGYKSPIIKDTAIKEDMSVGRSAEQKEEPIVSSDEIKKDAKQEVSLATKQIAENLSTKPQTAPKPQHIKKSDKVLLEKNEIKIKKTFSTNEQPSSNKENISKTAEMSPDKEPQPKYGADIGKVIIKRRTASKEGLEKSKTKDKLKTSSSLSVLTQESQKGISRNLIILENTDKTEINYWRRKVSTCTAQLQNQQKKKVQYMKKSDKSEKSFSGISLIDKEFIYRQLFEAYYKIAVMTADTTEEKQAVQFLKENADSLHNSKSAQALHFLEQYKIEKNRQKSSKHKTEE